jgi:hypothetical protein
MNFCLLALIFLISNFHSVNAFFFDNNKEYIEDTAKFQNINLNTKTSPLSDLRVESNKILFWDDLEKQHEQIALSNEEAFKNFSYNKITGMSNGLIDVTFQVRKGVKLAIEETFGGYAEYQKRKSAEEIVNSSFENRKKLNKTLFFREEEFGEKNIFDLFNIFSNNINKKTSSYKIINSIINTTIIDKLRKTTRYFAMLLLSAFLIIKVLQQIKKNVSVENIFSQNILQVISIIIFIKFSSVFFDIHLNLFNNASLTFLSYLEEYNLINNMHTSAVWNEFSKQAGYFPSLAIAILDLISQIFIGLFYLILIAYVSFSIVLFPFWVLPTIFSSLKNHFSNNYLKWIQANLALIASPILIIIFDILAQQLQGYSLFLCLLAKTLSFYGCPLVMLFIFFKINNKSNGDCERINENNLLIDELKDLIANKQ